MTGRSAPARRAGSRGARLPSSPGRISRRRSPRGCAGANAAVSAKSSTAPMAEADRVECIHGVSLVARAVRSQGELRRAAGGVSRPPRSTRRRSHLFRSLPSSCRQSCWRTRGVRAPAVAERSNLGTEDPPMRCASIAVLLLLTAGCGGEKAGPPAAEPSRVETQPSAEQPAAEAASAATPQSEPAAASAAEPPSVETPPATAPHRRRVARPDGAGDVQRPPAAAPADAATPTATAEPAAEPAGQAAPQPAEPPRPPQPPWSTRHLHRAPRLRPLRSLQSLQSPRSPQAMRRRLPQAPSWT